MTLICIADRERFTLRSRLVAGLAMLGGGLITLPWLWRSFQMTGQFPGLDLLLSAVLGTERETSVDLATFGVGRGPLDLLSIPWAATFQGELFGQNGAGALGLLGSDFQGEVWQEPEVDETFIEERPISTEQPKRTDVSIRPIRHNGVFIDHGLGVVGPAWHVMASGEVLGQCAGTPHDDPQF